MAVLTSITGFDRHGQPWMKLYCHAECPHSPPEGSPCWSHAVEIEHPFDEQRVSKSGWVCDIRGYWICPEHARQNEESAS